MKHLHRELWGDLEPKLRWESGRKLERTLRWKLGDELGPELAWGLVLRGELYDELRRQEPL